MYWYLQRDNVRNQRENLILLLSNVHIKLIPKPEPTNKASLSFACLIIYKHPVCQVHVINDTFGFNYTFRLKMFLFTGSLCGDSHLLSTITAINYSQFLFFLCGEVRLNL